MTKKAKCYLCDKEIEKNEVGLSKKLLGRNTTRYYCISCLADYLDISADDLLTKIEEFKEQGCRLFS